MPGLIIASGMAILLAGVIWLITSIFHPNNHDLDATRRPTWKPAIGGQAFSYLFGVLGLVGVYLRLGEGAGVIALGGFILAILGSALTITTNLTMAYLLPSVAAAQDPPRTVMDLLGPRGPMPWLSAITASYLLLFVPGYILLGIAVLRSPSFPPDPGWLLIGGMILSNIGVLGRRIWSLRIVGGVLFGAGMAWLGLVLL